MIDEDESQKISLQKQKIRKYSKEEAEDIAKTMKELPEKEKNKTFTKKDLISFLRKEIIALQKKGYAIEEIIEFLSKKGIQTTQSTLKNYLRPDKGRIK